ncbi:MAG: hypothetical protein AAFR31_16825 [Cyanobacteria bacterium J06627_8]
MLWAIARWMQDTSEMISSQSFGRMATLPSSLRLLPSPQDVVTDWKTAIATSTQTWFREHPFLAWSLDHPMMSVIGLLLALLFIVSFLQLTVEVARQLWLVILQLPLQIARWVSLYLAKLARWSLTKIGRFLHDSLLSDEQGAITKEAVPHDASPVTTIALPEHHAAIADQEIAQLLYRLEELTQEQTKILHQIARLTEAQSVSNRIQLN